MDTEQSTKFNAHLLDLQNQLYYYALQLTSNREDARDLVQETSYKALKNKNLLHSDKHVRAWLYTILRNSYINQIRSGHNRQIISENSDLSNQAVSSPVPQDENPDRIYEREELMSIVGKLPLSYSQPLKLHLSGYAYKEISRILSIPIGTVKSRIHLSKKLLRNCYNC
ncbi:MAG: RNA polymerase sigma factor [Bacteroidota bacterium]